MPAGIEFGRLGFSPGPRARYDDSIRTEEIRLADPWLELEWDDFMGLCAESIDLFAV